MAETREESQATVRAAENQTSPAKENQMGGIKAEKRQTSIPENQTIVAYTDDEQTSKSTFVLRLQSWFKEKHGKQIKLN